MTEKNRDIRADIEARAQGVLEPARKFLQEDGGDVKVVGFEPDTQTLVVSYIGECLTCPLQMFTLRAGLEPLVQQQVPEVRRLELADTP